MIFRFLVALMVLASVGQANPGASAFLEFNGGLRGTALPRQFAADTADRYGSNWRALRVPLATGNAYEANTPAFFTLGLQAWYDSSFEIYARFPLRKDLEAWYQDDLHSTQAFVPSAVDLNVPIESWARWNNPVGFVQLGRFKPDLGPSPNTLVLGGAPWHDGLWWKFAAGVARFDFVLSSLNPYLMGTPDSVGAEPPEGSEAWQQLYNTVPNQRKRTFTDPSKNLLVHRVGLDFSHGWVAIIEQSLIGGKDLALRDFNPFIAWHNNFGDGYTKASTTFEAGLKPGRTSTFYWQLDLEEIASPVGETSGETNPTTIGMMAGYKQTIPLQAWGTINSRFDVVYTDPVFNNHRVPLQKMTSRRLYRSNYRAQEEQDFADVYIVDYPLGYRRGPDAVDLWWNVSYHNVNKNYGADLEMAWLRQGSCEIYDDYDSCKVFDQALSGVVERSLQADLTLWGKPWHQTLLYVGGGARRYRNLENIAGDNGVDGWGRIGVQYTLGKDRHPRATIANK
jgi:hypothetical protein